MAPHSGDKSLLDRLNALKPTSVNLDRSTNALSIPATGIDQPAAEPLSREDALSERLRSLRNRRDHVEKSDNVGSDPPPPYTASSPSPSATRAQPPPPPARGTTGDEAGSGSRRSGGGGDEAAEGGGSQSSGDYDHYFDDVLQPLDLEDEGGSDSDGGAGGDGSSKRVEDLLAKLKADPGPAQPPLPAGGNKPEDPSDKAKDESSDDDSEGEAMSHEVENVIARAMDELNLDGPAPPQPGEPDVPSPGGEPGADDRRRAAASPGGDDQGLALPMVPRDAADREEHDTSSKGSDDGDGDSGEAGLSLPAVPTKLVDPAPTSGAVSDGSGDPFETSIEARLAALKGGGAPIIHTDSLGLPSAPTFRPEDNRAPAPKVGTGRAGYTDADQQTWCIVCLEDGTVRCLGCAGDGSGVGDVYCARCWREMHVGPAAGYDERGHAWERFDPRRV